VMAVIDLPGSPTVADVIHRRARLYRFGPFELDVRAGELRKHGIRLRLREQPLRILLLLLERPGEVVLRTEIRDKLWPNQTVVEFDHGINAAIKKLRDALGESAEEQRYIETVARRGYRFLGQVEAVEAPASEPTPSAAVSHETDDLEGKSVSHYLVFDKLGGGGMGVVFRAKDLKLKRKVALKFLPEEYSKHTRALDRFQQEARAAAALNHPNICTIYEIGEHESRPFISMELLEGQALNDLLAERSLPPEELLALAMQIAGALSEAHRSGIVHRDIKPANLFVTRRGQVKILDFGLAKLSPEGLIGRAAASTTAGQQTRSSSPVGTVAYMSPEQIGGEAADPRSDIFSLGVVLHEMAGGKRAFGGGSSVETMNAILRDDPAELPRSVPPELDRIVRRCLEKRPAQRFQSAAELGLELETLYRVLPAAVPTRERRARLPRTGFWIAATAVMAVLLAGLAVIHIRESPAKPPAIQFSIYPPAGVRFGEVRYEGPPLISPDGSQLAFGGIDERGIRQLWVRPLRSLTARPLPGTEGAWYPFWSPDSRWLGFFVGRKLKKVSIDGGQVQALANAGCCGGTWARTEDGDPGTIVFGTEDENSLQRIPAEGGEPVRITSLDLSRDEVHLLQPHFLPDGRHFLFLADRGQEDSAVCIADAYSQTDPTNVRRVSLRGTSHVWWGPPGYLLFVRDNNLLAQAFDARHFEVSGVPILVAEHVGDGFNRRTSDFSVSANGVLAWRSGFNADRQLAWFDRSGKQLAGLDSHEPYLSPRLSPDGGQLAMIRRETPVVASPPTPSESSFTRNIWLMDLSRGSVSPVTLGKTERPAWSPDGRRIVFGRSEKPTYGLYWKPAREIGNGELLLRTEHSSTPLSWSPDGRFILFRESTDAADSDLFALPLAGERKPILISRQADYGEFSPDGRWIAYAWGASGRWEIWVQSFAGLETRTTPGKWQVSNSGGWNPRWRRDGRELFYYSVDFQIMEVPVDTGSKFQCGTPVPLFHPHDHDPTDFDFEVSADGHRFLVSRLFEDDSRPVNISLDWLAEVKK